MKDKIYITENISNAVSGVEALKSKSSRSDKVGLFYGLPGLGKSTFLLFYYTNNPCFYVRAWAAWSRSINMMVEDLLKCYRVEARGRLKQDLRELVVVMKRSPLPLFIDEADRVVRKTILIETIRDLADITRIPIVLIGQEQIINLLQRKDLGHVFSRISEIVEFKPLTVEDVKDISTELCELECGFEVASFVRTVTLGDFRLLNVFLTKAEVLCMLNKTHEITLPIAKEASKILPSHDDLKRAVSRGNMGADESQRVRAAI